MVMATREELETVAREVGFPVKLIPDLIEQRPEHVPPTLAMFKRAMEISLADFARRDPIGAVLLILAGPDAQNVGAYRPGRPDEGGEA